MVDHVKQYKIPREYMYLSDDQNDQKANESDESDKVSVLERK